MLDNAVLGLDVAKATLAAALLPATLPPAGIRDTGPQCTVPNTPVGHAALLAWVQAHGVPHLHACLEATNTYGETVATTLHAAGYTVSVVNPRRTHHFAETDDQRGKTDPQDAVALARFCREKRPRPWTPPTPALHTLQAMARRLDALQAMRRQEGNRQADPTLAPWEAASIAAIIAALDHQVAAVLQQLRALIAADPLLTRHLTVLVSIPGIAEQTAWRILAEVGDRLHTCTPRQLAAYAGLTPVAQQSGTSLQRKPHLGKRGNARLRRALFYPALVALRYNPVIRAFAARLRAAGKARMAIVGAAMHKLLKLAVILLQAGALFDPAYGRPKA